MEISRMINSLVETSGDGRWSQVNKTVKITNLTVHYVNDDQDFGELRVYFSTPYFGINTTLELEHSWDNNDGLIYTDKGFIRGVKSLLIAHGFDSSDVGYSEQSMQGDNYVSFDVGAKFLASVAVQYALELI